jgi:chlorite dismutase
MPEQTPRTLNHYAMVAFKDPYWDLMSDGRAAFHAGWLAGLNKMAQKVDIFQSAESGVDILIWSAVQVEELGATAEFFERFARACSPYRHLIEIKGSLWGYTRPSQYTKSRSTQEIDPFAETRKRYLVMYPFVKTVEWYLMSREARQGMMNEHIRIGKQYEEIKQLLLYSFGVQDQEFVVVYEMDDLQQFSDLVNELRSSEARRYTLRDTPLHTAIYHPAAETLALWK